MARVSGAERAVRSAVGGDVPDATHGACSRGCRPATPRRRDEPQRQQRPRAPDPACARGAADVAEAATGVHPRRVDVVAAARVGPRGHPRRPVVGHGRGLFVAPRRGRHHDRGGVERDAVGPDPRPVDLHGAPRRARSAPCDEVPGAVEGRRGPAPGVRVGRPHRRRQEGGPGVQEVARAAHADDGDARAGARTARRSQAPEHEEVGAVGDHVDVVVEGRQREGEGVEHAPVGGDPLRLHRGHAEGRRPGAVGDDERVRARGRHAAEAVEMGRSHGRPRRPGRGHGHQRQLRTRQLPPRGEVRGPERGDAEEVLAGLRAGDLRRAEGEGGGVEHRARGRQPDRARTERVLREHLAVVDPADEVARRARRDLRERLVDPGLLEERGRARRRGVEAGRDPVERAEAGRARRRGAGARTRSPGRSSGARPPRSRGSARRRRPPRPGPETCPSRRWARGR